MRNGAAKANEGVSTERLDLPPLDQTDGIVRQLVGQLSSNPKVAAWLTTDQLVRNFTVVVFNISNGRTPAKHLGKLRPAEKFTVMERGTDITLDPRSYHRYDAYGDAFAGLDAWPRDARDEATLVQPDEVFGGEVRLVRAQFDGLAPPWSPAGPDCGDAEDERLEGETAVHVRT